MQTQIIISDISIHQDSEGRYSINDLHKAAGAKEKDKPSNWLRSEKTIELINTILNAQIRAFNPVDSYKGRYGGTYVCKELVYAYATWISSEFFLKVISAYDALVSGDTEKAESIAKTTVDDRTPLRSLVNRIMGKYGMTYQAVYKLVHKEFGVKHIDELSPRQATEAMEYLAAKAIEGEFLGKQESLPKPIASQFSDAELLRFVSLYLWMERAQKLGYKVYPALRDMESRLAGDFWDLSRETTYIMSMCYQSLTREVGHIEPGSVPGFRIPEMMERLHR